MASTATALTRVRLQENLCQSILLLHNLNLNVRRHYTSRVPPTLPLPIEFIVSPLLDLDPDLDLGPGPRIFPAGSTTRSVDLQPRSSPSANAPPPALDPATDHYSNLREH
ncbi:hypothetical protein HYQ46_009197 [Verticillium longisporum]|nr:hypothetical protein HYQ46_009197 [Verticillium longisporum]